MSSNKRAPAIFSEREQNPLAKLGRRGFLLNAGLAGAGAMAFDALVRRADILISSANTSLEPNAAALGPLIPTESENTGEQLLALPKGFRYTVFGKTGKLMSDGRPTPDEHDGMAAFKVKGQLRLVRNHEVNTLTGTANAAQSPHAYDPLAGGGTTTLIIDPRTREVVKDFLSLSGTLINCAGGATPWNSWISCEETTRGHTRFKNDLGQDLGGFSQPHGYCFEVPAAADSPVSPVPLKAMGRFVHEALAVDPKTGIVYLTEDVETAGFYRFLPNQPGKLAEGGRLQMLVIKNQPRFDARTQQKPGLSLPVSWVEIPEPDPAAADTDVFAVYKQGIAAGAATFRRLEGCFYGRGQIFFTSTTGGEKRLGQVWQYTPGRAGDGGTLTLLFEATDPAIMNMPDNLCLTRAGDLLICEDNSASVHLQLLTRSGEVSQVVKNIAPGFETREFAGVTFSPDGRTLFLNLQVPGMTFAIWGPWDRI